MRRKPAPAQSNGHKFKEPPVKVEATTDSSTGLAVKEEVGGEEDKVPAHECQGYGYDAFPGSSDPAKIEHLFAQTAAEAMDNMPAALRKGYAWPFSSEYVGALKTEDGEEYWWYVRHQQWLALLHF